jgi:uncharacterized protein YigE (DUF2233 family)
MRLLFALFLIAAGCEQISPVAPSTQSTASTCTNTDFEGSRFWVCRASGPVEVRGGYRRFADLAQALGGRADDVAFAMNAGMFDDQGKAIGLLVEDGRELKAINRREGGGNFHLMPNGVFFIRRDGSSQIVTSDSYYGGKDVAFASQSGPMLLIGGKMHPKLTVDGTSRHIRNAVGIDRGAQPIFVISRDPVSFGKLARLFRDRLDVRDALYLDGSVSSLWDPANDRLDAFTDLGPMVVAFKPVAESTPDHEDRARP